MVTTSLAACLLLLSLDWTFLTRDAGVNLTLALVLEEFLGVNLGGEEDVEDI